MQLSENRTSSPLGGEGTLPGEYYTPCYKLFLLSPLLATSQYVKVKDKHLRQQTHTEERYTDISKQTYHISAHRLLKTLREEPES